MSPAEVRRELQEDYEDLRRWMGYRRKQWLRLARENVSREHSLSIIGDYKTPHRKNTWVFALRIMDRKMQHLQLCTGVVSWQQEGMAWTFYGRYQDENPFAASLRPPMPPFGTMEYVRYMSDVPPIIHFTPHFWLRLRERSGNRRYGMELVKSFIKHNDVFAVSTDREAMSATGRRMDDSLTLVLHRGAGLARQVEPHFYEVRTYISSRQEHGHQRDEHQQQRTLLPPPPQAIPLGEARRERNARPLKKADEGQ